MPKILIKRGSATQWANSTTPLALGELGLDTTNAIVKVGDGTSLWSALSGIVTATNLNNTLTDPANGYVPISDVGNADGVAPLNSSGVIPDLYIPSTITRDSELSSHNSATTSVHGISDTSDLLTTSNTKTLTNKTIGSSGLAFNSGANNSAIYTEGNNMSVYANANLYLNGNADVIIQPAIGSSASVRGDLIITSNASQTLNSKTLASPNLTGTPTAPTAALNTNTTQIATTEFVKSAIDSLVNLAPNTLDTLSELAAALNNDANYATTITNALATKLNISTAASTYLTQSNAASTYLTITNASGTYLTQANASLTYLSQSNASSIYAPIASPTFTGTVSGITKNMVGLGNVDNTSDQDKYKNDYTYSSATTINLSSSTHKFKVLEVTSASPISVVIPSDAQDSGWQVGSFVEVRQVGDGQVTVNKDAAVTYNAPDNQFKTRVKWSSLFIEKRAANTWIVTGDATA